MCAARARVQARVDKTSHLLREVTEVRGIVQDSLSDMLATRENLEVPPTQTGYTPRWCRDGAEMAPRWYRDGTEMVVYTGMASA